MSLELIKYAFTAGELSRKLFGRPDLEKYDLGLALAKNWFVDYHGGISTRPGFEMVDYVKTDAILVPFKFNSNIANTYLLVFGPGYIRFMQDGAYVLEDSVTIQNIYQSNPAEVVATAHGYHTGEWVKIGGMTFSIEVTSINSFTLWFPNGLPFSSFGEASFITNTSVNRIYTIVSPYLLEELPALRFSQRLDRIRITRANYEVRELIRSGHTDWALEVVDFNPQVTPPTSLTGVPITAGTYGFAWTVTTVNTDGIESGIGTIYLETATNNFASTAGGYRYTWNATGDTAYYNIYRSNIVEAGQANRGLELGFIGRAYGAAFSELNIVPDFTQTPLVTQTLFEGGKIENITINNGGSGYDNTTVVTVTGGGGSGFVGWPIVSAGGGIVGVFVQNGGSGYTSAPTIAFTVGTGAVATASRSPIAGEFPTLSARFQQRDIYAASLNNPLTIWGSRTGQTNNFNYNRIPIDSDPFEFTIDSDELTPIKHLLPMRSGLLVMTDYGVWQLTGGGLNDAVTPQNALADPHSYIGISDVPPLRVDTDVVYQEAKGSAVRQLAYNEVTKVYGGTDISILSSHFISSGNKIKYWTYADSPYKMVWSVRADGALLALTLVKEQNIYAWTQNWTKGYFRNIASIQENSTDSVYVVTERIINGRTVRFIERMHNRKFTYVEDAFCVDCGLRLGSNHPGLALSISVDPFDTDYSYFTVPSALFSGGAVGKILRAGGGKAIITDFINADQIRGRWLRAFTDYIPETNTPAIQDAGTWTIDAPVSSVSGLWHLEGQTVSALIDGNVYTGFVVANGTIDFPDLVTGTRVIVGLPYSCQAQTLPLTVTNDTIESRRKRVVGGAFRLDEARGVKVGRSLSKLYEFKERMNEPIGEPTNLISRYLKIPTQPNWDNDGQMYFVVDDPLPATVLGIVLDTEIGDDPE